MALVLKSAKVNEREIILEIYALGKEQVDIANSVNQGEKVRAALNWLPELMSQSVLKDIFPCHLPSLDSRFLRECSARSDRGTDITVAEWRDMLDSGLVKNRAELARRVGVSRARVTQALRAAA